MLLTHAAVKKDIKSKKNFEHNLFLNILRHFNVLGNLPFTTSETVHDYF